MDQEQKITPLICGQKVKFRKKITQGDVNKFAELTGDFSPNHVDEAFMKKSSYGKCIAHGALLVGYMSTTSSMIVEKYASHIQGYTPVSLGYDRMRFIKPVFIDDNIKVEYTIEKYDTDKLRSLSNIEITNQNGELVAVAKHILKWVTNP
jgi:3-hydroxybutyryl-CoA dehydratase